MAKSSRSQLIAIKRTEGTAVQNLVTNWVMRVIATLSVIVFGSHLASAAEIKIQVNEDAPIIINPVDSINSSGVNVLLGSYNDPSGNWNLNWNLKLDTKADDNLVSTAIVKFSNQSNTEQAVKVWVNQPLDVMIEDAKMGAIGIVKMVADQNGGMLSSNGNLPQLSALIDGDIQFSLGGPFMYYAPFSMTATGASSSSTNSTFGLPFPSSSLSVGDYEQSHGMRFATVVTDGDVAELTLATYINGEVILPPPPPPPPPPTPPAEPQDPEQPVDLPTNPPTPVQTPPVEAPIEAPVEAPAPTPVPAPELQPVTPPVAEEVVFQMVVSTNQRKISRGVIAKRGFLHVTHDSDATASAVLQLRVGKSSCQIGSLSVGPFDPVKVSFTRKGLLRGLKGRGTFELTNANGDALSSAAVRFQAFGKPVPAGKKLPKNKEILDCSGIVLRQIQ